MKSRKKVQLEINFSPLTFQIIIKQLKDKVENIKSEIEEKSSDVTTHLEQKQEAKNELSELITNCEELYNDYDVVRIQVRTGFESLHATISD